MEFELKDVAYLIAIIVSTLVSFFGTRHRLNERIRDNAEETQKEVHKLELQISDLSNKYELQKQVSTQIGDQMTKLIPSIINAINKKEVLNEQ